MPFALLASLLVAADAGVDPDVSTWVDRAQAHQARLEANRPAYRYHRLPDDPNRPDEIRLGFAPKKPAKDRTQGEARLDAQGQVLEVKGSPSVLPTLADEVRFVLDFGRPSAQGPALSSLTFEGKGGVLFIRKHVRSVTTIRVGDLPPEG